MDKLNISMMEGRFEKIIMESALKMASVTDANVFVLIESENKRYFGGKRHLCEAFSIGGLLPQSLDIKMQVDLDSSCLKPQPQLQHELGNTTENRLLNSHYLPGNHGVSMMPEPWSVQPFPITSTPFPKVKKRKSPIGEEIIPKRLKAEIMADNLFPIKSELPDDQALKPYSSFEAGRHRLPDDGQNEAICDASQSIYDASQPIYDASDDDDDVDLIYDNFVDGGLAEGEIKRERDDGFLSLPQDLDYLDHTQWIYDRLQEDEKTLKKLNDTRALTDMDQLRGSDSVRRKEVLSVFYALGSRFARACNITEATYDPKYHRALFERVWTMFPNFQAHATMNISRNTGRLGCLISRCRDSFLAPFRKRLIRLKRKLAAASNAKVIELDSGDELEAKPEDDGGKDDDKDDGEYIELLPFELEDFDHSEWICERLKKDPKVFEKFKTVVAMDEIEVKLKAPGSPERKLILTLFYALGSYCAKASNPIDARYNLQYQKDLFQKIWTMFPNLVPFSAMTIVRDGTRRGPLMARCRDAFLCPFRRQQIKLRGGKC